MKAKYLLLAAMAANLACSGAAHAQYYDRRGGYDDGYGGGGYRYCRAWAQGMVAIGLEAARKGCLQYGPQGLHTNFDAHMDFCLSNSPGRTQRAAARANQLLYACDR